MQSRVVSTVLKITVLLIRLYGNFLVHAMELLGLMISVGHNLLFSVQGNFHLQKPTVWNQYGQDTKSKLQHND